jgi:ferrochelatase
MAFYNTEKFDHSQSPRIGVLLLNLGSPSTPTKPDLRTYLREFLSDPRVVEVPRAIWMLVLHGIILNVRPARSAEAYSKVWTRQGAPLVVHTRNQSAALGRLLKQQYGDHVICTWAMRYGERNVHRAVQSLSEQGVRRLLVLPLFPQYSGATTASAFDALAADLTRRRWVPELRFITHYHDYEPYIDALAGKIEAHWARQGRSDKLLFSYHGTPVSYLHRGDPYHCECHKTTRLLAERLGLEPDSYLTTFQSRFGREPWLLPYTDETLKSLAAQGCRSVQVICPGFASDCLETLEEIDMAYRKLFLQAGGQRFEYIEALNSDPAHIAMLARLVNDNLAGWKLQPFDGAATKARAIKLGAER